MHLIDPTRHRAGRVVIFESPGRPARAFGPIGHRIGDQLGRQSLRVEKVEAIRAVETSVTGGECLHFAQRMIAANLGQGKAAAIAVRHRSQPLEEFDDVGVRLVVQVQLKIEGPRTLAARRRRRIIAQLGVVHREVDRIDAEAVDAAAEPKACDVQQRILHGQVVDVEIRLIGQKIVEIILAAPAVPGPRWPTEHRLPIVWR